MLHYAGMLARDRKAQGLKLNYPEAVATFDVALRIYPSNPLLPHRMDFALVKWA